MVVVEICCRSVSTTFGGLRGGSGASREIGLFLGGAKMFERPVLLTRRGEDELHKRAERNRSIAAR